MNLKEMLNDNGVLCSLPLSRQIEGLDISPGFEVFTKPGEVATEIILVNEIRDLNSIFIVTVCEHYVHCHCCEFGQVVADNVIIDKNDIDLELFRFACRTEGKVIRDMSAKHMIDR